MSRSPKSLSVSPKLPVTVTPAAVPDVVDSSALSAYAFPLGALALCGAGALYLVKRIGDLESSVGAMKRETVRNLSETDVRMIVQQMQKDGLIRVQQWEAPPPSPPQLPPAQQPRAHDDRQAEAQRFEQAKRDEYARHLQQQQQQQDAPAQESNATPWVPRSKRQ